MDKTSNVTVRLHEVMKVFLTEAKRSEQNALYDVINTSMGNIGNTEPLPLSTTLRNHLNFVSLLLETETFMLKHDEMPQRYLQTIKQLINWFTSNTMRTTSGTFFQSFPRLEYDFFEELKFSSRSEHEEENFESIYAEIYTFTTEAEKTIKESHLPDDVKKHLEHLLFQLIRSSNSYKYNGKSGFDESLNTFIAEMGRATQRYSSSASFLVGLMLKGVHIAEKLVLAGDLTQLPNVFMNVLSGGE